MVLFAMIVWIIYAKMITNMAVIEYILQIKSQKKEQVFATYGIVGLFIYKIYSITAMLVIIFAYIILTHSISSLHSHNT